MELWNFVLDTFEMTFTGNWPLVIDFFLIWYFFGNDFCPLDYTNDYFYSLEYSITFFDFPL